MVLLYLAQRARRVDCRERVARAFLSLLLLVSPPNVGLCSLTFHDRHLAYKKSEQQEKKANWNLVFYVRRRGLLSKIVAVRAW